MNFFAGIRQWFIFATQILVYAALDCYQSPILPDFLGDIFRDLSDFTAEVVGFLYDAEDWWDYVTSRIGEVLSWDYIKSLISSWLTGIEALIIWWSDWWGYVTDVIESWWQGIRDTLNDLIMAAVGELIEGWENWLNFWNNLWPDLVSIVNSVSSAWDSFWTVTYPTLIDTAKLTLFENTLIVKLAGIIDTAFTLREGLWAGWQEIRDNVVEFFTDPLEFIWARFSEWFLGPEA